MEIYNLILGDFRRWPGVVWPPCFWRTYWRVLEIFNLYAGHVNAGLSSVFLFLYAGRSDAGLSGVSAGSSKNICHFLFNLRGRMNPYSNCHEKRQIDELNHHRV